jgi:hypothetical protein
MREKILFVIVVGLFWSTGVLAGNFPVYQWAPESQTSMHGIHFISGGSVPQPSWKKTGYCTTQMVQSFPE